MKEPRERIAAIAREYAESPENTLVVSPDNRSRIEINQQIHKELQARASWQGGTSIECLCRARR